ncbi:MAG: polysaccharide biosynthesis tyrosine autokinase [Desulfomonile tiedjei]|nr:polysaccharide biosynthesis tyrosine autokinase [Desulfomonile tiedjei]
MNDDHERERLVTNGQTGNPSKNDLSREGFGGYNYHSADEGYSYGADDGRNFHSYFRAIRYRKWLVLGVFVTVVGLGWTYALRTNPVFRSEATLEIQRLFPTSANLNDLFSSFGQFDLYFQTQVLALRSKEVAESFLVRTNRLPSLQTKDQSAGQNGTSAPRPLSQEEERARTSAVNGVLSRISVEPIKGTQLIQVSMSAAQAGEARQMLQEYVDAYMALNERKRVDFAENLRSLLRKDLEEAETQLRKSEQDLQEFTAKNGMVMLDRPHDQMASFLSGAASNLLRTTEARLNIEALNRAKDSVVGPQNSEQYLQNLKTEVASLKSEYASLKALYSPDYFKLVLLRSKIQGLEKAVTELEESTLSSSLETAKSKEAVAREAFEKEKEEALKKSPLSAQYEILKSIMTANGQLYITLLQKFRQAALDPAILGHTVSLFSPPTLPSDPLQTIPYKLLFLIPLLGLAGGVAVALILEQLDHRVQTTDELERTMRVPILGVVPKTAAASKLRAVESDRGPIEFTPFLLPMSQLADSIRVIESAAESMFTAEGGTSVCISSALPLEGKTFVTVSLGAAMATENKRVLIIDGDMRRPRVQRIFEEKIGGLGLGDLMSGKCEKLDAAVRKSRIPGLFYMPAGSATENPVALLKSKRLVEVLSECKRYFDVVLLDAPPLIGMADATILARSADGLILVTKQGYTPVEVLRRTQETVQLRRVRLLGVVFNMVRPEASEYEYYKVKYGYRYYRSRHSA